MLRLTESTFRGQVLRVCVYREETERKNLCVCACARTSVYVLLTWNQSCGGVIMILALFPEGSSVTAPGRDCKLPHSPRRVDDANRSWGDGEVLFFSLWRGLESYLHLYRGGRSYCLKKPGLSHTWMDSLQGSRPLKSVWVMSCQHRGEQQQIGLLKQFSSTGGLLSACQLPDYSIQLFGCSQSAQGAPRARPRWYLSIPDTGINSAAPQRWSKEGYRKCNLMEQHLFL